MIRGQRIKTTSPARITKGVISIAEIYFFFLTIQFIYYSKNIKLIKDKEFPANFIRLTHLYVYAIDKGENRNIFFFVLNKYKAGCVFIHEEKRNG